jgi:hypothetical protein
MILKDNMSRMKFEKNITMIIQRGKRYFFVCLVIFLIFFLGRKEELLYGPKGRAALQASL